MTFVRKKFAFNVDEIDYRLRLVVKMDQTFVSRFGQESGNVMRRVLAHAQEYFNLPSFVTKIKLQVGQRFGTIQ